MGTTSTIVTETAIIELEKILAEAKSDNEAIAAVLSFREKYLKEVSVDFDYKSHLNGASFKMIFFFFDKKGKKKTQNLRFRWHNRIRENSN